MNLLQVRTNFRRMSGRFDLVNSDNTDNGANFYINEGRKFLDRLDENQKSWGQYFGLLSIGSFSFTFPLCRSIKEVWLATATARWQAEKMRLQDLMASYLTGLPSSRTRGEPAHYSPCISRYIPEDAVVTSLAAFAGFVEIPSGNAHEYNCILLSVPVSVQVMVDIRGLFYSKELIADTDFNYWSTVHPQLLIMAAQRQVEIMNRNTEGVNDWTNAIMAEITQIGKDFVEEQIAESDVMEG